MRRGLSFLSICAGLVLPSSAAAADAVRFSHARGFYDAPFELVLDTELEGATVRYTLDGSTPTRTRGAAYTGPLSIAGTAVVRAIAYNGTTETNVATSTFLFLEQVAGQPRYPSGYVRATFSAHKGRMQNFDYEMDPEIVGGEEHHGDFSAYLRGNPSLSIVLDRNDFNTIYTNHRLRGVAWERPASVELLYPAGAEFQGFAGFQVDCGIRMHGGLAVDQARKKSFRLLFKKIYGSGKLRYPLFESAVHQARTATRRFDTVVLRAGGNTNWSKDDAYKHAPSTYLRDQFVRDTSIEMSGIGARGLFVHLYINGLYFGLYNVTERPDAKFMAAYLGGAEEDYHSVNHHGTVGGDPARWNQLMSVVLRGSRSGSDPRRWTDGRPLEQLVNFENFSDYIILNWFVGMGDWPYNNWYAGNRNRPPGGAMFFSWDAELAFWPTDYHYSNPGAWVNPHFRRWSVPIALFWQALAQHGDFLITFSDRVYRHCENGGALSDGRITARFRRLADSIEEAIVAESARWGDAARGNENTPHTRRKDWYPNRDMVLRLMDGNAERLIAALRYARFYPSVDPPELPRRWPPLERGSPVKAGFEVRLRNPNRAGRIIYTTDGSDPREPGTGVPSRHAIVYRASAPLVVRETTRVKARVERGREWSALSDVLYLVGHSTLPLRITEVMYQPRESEALEFIEMENVSSAPVDVTGLSLEGVDYHFPPGRNVRGREVLVLVPNDDPAAFKRKYPDVDIFGTYRGHLANTGEMIRLVTAREVITQMEYDPRDRGARLAAGGGHSLEVIDVNGVAEDSRNWRVSAGPGGTPGRVGSEGR